MKKGFTLIELLGVIILLGVLSLIAYPIIQNTIKNSRENAYIETIQNIERAALLYSVNHDLGENEYYKKIDIIELKNTGLLKDEEIRNPINNEQIQGCVKYKWKTKSHQYEFQYSEECDLVAPNVEITFSILNAAINNQGWANRDFYVKVTASNASQYRWCSTILDTCDPIATVKGEYNSVLINKESTDNKICVIATNQLGEEQQKICSSNYQLDKTAPTLTAKNEEFEFIKGSNVLTNTYFNPPNYSISGGILSCNPVNTLGLELGNQTVSCTAIGNNGLQTTATKMITVLKDEIGPDNGPDGIADKYQITVTYTASIGGTVSGMTKEVLTLYKDGIISVDGKASPIASITTTANSGYRFASISVGSETLNSISDIRNLELNADTVITVNFVSIRS